MKKSWKSFMTVTAAAAAMTAAMAFSSLAAVAKVDDDLPENRHIVSVASGGYETGFQIKAAHGAEIYETTSYPIDKKADGEDEIGTVSQGKKIRFTLTSSLPKLLARYVVTASNASPANSAREIRKVRVHSASGRGNSPRTQCVRCGDSPRVQRIRCRKSGKRNQGQLRQ